MSLPKFAKPDILYEAVTTGTPGLMTSDQIYAMNRAWPNESNLADLACMTLEQNELWDKAEAYMIQVTEPASIPDRLKVWVFRLDFEDDKKFLRNSIDQMGRLFEFLETNTTLFKVLGMALAVGNILNGGTPKGRSDGFEFAVYPKLQSTKDNNNKSMLNFILKQLSD